MGIELQLIAQPPGFAHDDCAIGGEGPLYFLRIDRCQHAEFNQLADFDLIQAR